MKHGWNNNGRRGRDGGGKGSGSASPHVRCRPTIQPWLRLRPAELTVIRGAPGAGLISTISIAPPSTYLPDASWSCTDWRGSCSTAVCLLSVCLSVCLSIYLCIEYAEKSSTDVDEIFEMGRLWTTEVLVKFQKVGVMVWG